MSALGNSAEAVPTVFHTSHPNGPGSSEGTVTWRCALIQSAETRLWFPATTHDVHWRPCRLRGCAADLEPALALRRVPTFERRPSFCQRRCASCQDGGSSAS
jgi:hypothetical protein